jgi:hypothetical protein
MTQAKRPAGKGGALGLPLVSSLRSARDSRPKRLPNRLSLVSQFETACAVREDECLASGWHREFTVLSGVESVVRYVHESRPGVAYSVLGSANVFDRNQLRPGGGAPTTMIALTHRARPRTTAFSDPSAATAWA